MSRLQTIPAARITGRATPLNVSPRQRELEIRRMPRAKETTAQSWFVVMTLPLLIAAIFALTGALS